MNPVKPLAEPSTSAPWETSDPGRRTGATEEFNCWLEVDRTAFEGNLRRLQRLLGSGSLLCAVMKADAYGHGLALLMPSVVKLGVQAVGVTDNAEARIVRSGGYTKRLLRLRVATPGEIVGGLEYDMEEMLGNLDNAREMSALAGRHRRTVRYHLALNSGGMSRYGLEMSGGSGGSAALEILRLPHLRITGIMTHFPVRAREDAERGLEAFQKEAGWVMERGRLDRHSLTLHCANSFATLNVPEARLDMVRSGGLLYKPMAAGMPGHEGFQRVAQFKARVGAVNAYPAGNTVSYDRTCVLARASRLASISVGYSDGFRSLPSSQSVVLIQGQCFPVVGKGTMNTIMVDVTDHSGVRAGDEVVLFGRQGREEIPLEAFAKALGCPNWEEMATSIGNQNPKVLLT